MTALTEGCAQWLTSNNFSSHFNLTQGAHHYRPCTVSEQSGRMVGHLGAGPRPKDKQQRVKTEWSSIRQ